MRKNIYHRYLNLPFTINPPKMFLEDIPELPVHRDLQASDYDMTSVNGWLRSLGCSCIKTEAFFTPDTGIIPIHADRVPNMSVKDYVKINLTFGPKEGKVIWWEDKSQNSLAGTSHDYFDSEIAERYGKDTVEKAVKGFSTRAKGTDARIIEQKYCVKVWEANTNRPSLLNVDRLHSTWCPKAEGSGRWTICFIPITKVNKRVSLITWDLAMEVFKDYIVEEETVG